MENIDNKRVSVDKSKKRALLDRLRSKRPDLNVEDEESVYGAINDDYDNNDRELENYRESERSMVDLFNSDPRMAGMYAEMAKKGMSPLEYLIANYGDDFRAALEDPEKASSLVSAQNAYMEKVASNKALEAEAAANLQASLEALDEAKKELGCSDEEETKAFEQFTMILDDAIKDKVSKETWVMFLKGIRHDKDVEQADLEGEIRGKNEKINSLKSKQTIPQGLPPQLSGQGSPMKSSKPIEFGGVLGKYGEDYKSWDADIK